MMENVNTSLRVTTKQQEQQQQEHSGNMDKNFDGGHVVNWGCILLSSYFRYAVTTACWHFKLVLIESGL